MFSALIRQAHETVDSVVSQAVNRAIVAIPFLVAGGFATAALTIRLTAEFGTELGCLAVALLFAVIGFITAAVVMRPRAAAGSTQAATAAEAHAASSENAAHDAATHETSPVEKELLIAALTTVAPLALPAILRMAIKNLPILAAVGAALFVGSRAVAEPDDPVEAVVA